MLVLDTNLPASVSSQDAEGLLTWIHPGMTVGDIRKMFPRANLEQELAGEHGGMWFTLSIGENNSIQFRAAHPKPGDNIENSRINYSPRLRDRKTQIFISGEERTW
jgi:hypothetical protein